MKDETEVKVHNKVLKINMMPKKKSINDIIILQPRY